MRVQENLNEIFSPTLHLGLKIKSQQWCFLTWYGVLLTTFSTLSLRWKAIAIAAVIGCQQFHFHLRPNLLLIYFYTHIISLK